MKQILADIQREAGDTLSTVVYLGAGDGACLADLAGLSCRRTVLVEADPLCVDTLNTITSTGVEIVHALVSAIEGEVPFHRFTLPFLNSPLPREHFGAIYPRLSVVESIALPARPLGSLLGQLAIDGDSAALLIVDLPGQEEALFSSLTPIDIEPFSHLLIRTFAANTSDASLAPSFLCHLAGLGFDFVDKDASAEPTWPLFHLKKDPVKQSMQQELEKRAQLLVTKATQIHQQAEQIAALTAERNDLVQERDSLAARISALESEHSDLVTRHSSLVTERDALHSDLSAKSTLLDVLTEGRIAQDEQMDKLLQEQKTLISERDALASRVSDLISQVEKLEAHAKLIDEEFGKAEGQIELIKDIFLREAIR